jgi:glycosyltransferase involved in cell wall biosynthesis
MRRFLWMLPPLRQLRDLRQSVRSLEVSARSLEMTQRRLLAQEWRDMMIDVMQLQQDVRTLVATQKIQCENSEAAAAERIRLGWVSSWNSRCGIASYAHSLLDAVDRKDMEVTVFSSYLEQPSCPDASSVVRCWGNSGTSDVYSLIRQITKSRITVAVFQFHFAFFNVTSFGIMLDVLQALRVAVIVIFHATESDHMPCLENIKASLARANGILVHSEEDYSRMTSFGLENNLSIFPHGVAVRPVAELDTAKARKGLTGRTVISTYGFLLPNKGIEALIEAFSILSSDDPQLYLQLVNAIYPLDISKQIKEKCAAKIRNLGLQERVSLVTDFLPDEESFAHLECSDLIVLPYRNSQESTSGAVRIGLAANRPVACTPLAIFDDVKDVVHFLPGTSPKEIAKGIRHLLRDPRALDQKVKTQHAWLKEHDWAVIGTGLSALIRAKHAELWGQPRSI